MSTRTTIRLLIAILLVAVAIGAYYYPSLPDRIATHWNADGVADGFSSKFWGIILIPLIMLGIAGLYFLIPVIDPLRKNIESFRPYFNLFWVVIVGFLLYVHLLVLAYNTGREFNFGVALLAGLAVVLWVAGILIQHSKRSWFVGIRTPWTLSDDTVWERTHRLGGTLFKLAAVASLAGLFFGGLTLVWFVLIPIGTAAIISVVYSFVLYRRLHP